MKARVECRSSDRYARQPLAFHWQGVRLVVTRWQAEWRTPAARHFRVETADGQFFELAYSEVLDEWTIEQP